MKLKNVLFIGLGSIGQRHLRNLLKIQKRLNIYAFRKKKICPLLDKNNKKINGNIERKYKVINLTNFKNVKFDLVFITNPSSMHIDTLCNIKNLKNSYVFIEKPIDVNPEKIQKLKKFKNENNLKIFVACNLRFNKVYDIFKKFLNKSPLGKINYVIVKSSLNIKDFHNYENYEKSYTSKKILGGGINFTSIHEIDLINNLFDKKLLINSFSKKISNLKVNINDFSSSLFKTTLKKDKFITMLIMDHFQINKERYISATCEKGEIKWDLVSNKIFINKKGSKKIVKFKIDNNEMYINQLKFFIKLVKSNRKIPDIYSEKNGIECLKIAIKINSNQNKS